MQAAEYREIADKYAETVEENRRLYNEVQDLKGNIRVYCRVRPQGATGDYSDGSPQPFNETPDLSKYQCLSSLISPQNKIASSHAMLIRGRIPLTGCTEVGLDGELALYDPQRGRRKVYKYDKVFGVDSTQQEVYEDTKALIRSVLDGKVFRLL